MKRLYFYIASLFLILTTTTGCKDFLQEENLSNVQSDEFYKTAEGYERLINASYSSLRSVYSDPFIYTAGTDMFVEGRDAQPPGISEYRNLTPEEETVLNFYRRVYAAIQTCNTAIYFNDITTQTTNTPVRKGEAKFLRAYYYFLLVQTFGDVSLVTDRILEPQEGFKRNSASEVYNFIINEMTEALNLVPETTPDFGRVTKRAVRHFLAKVYLTRSYEPYGDSLEDAKKAATFADAAINNEKLNTAFEDIFFPGNEKNPDVLFSIQFDPASIVNPQTGGNSQNYWFGPYMGGQGATQGYPQRAYRLVPTMYLFDVFNQDDARFDATFMIEYYNRYYDYYDKRSERNSLDVRFYYAPQWASSPADIAAWRAVNPARRGKTTVIPYSNAWQAGRTTANDNATPAIKKFDDPKSAFGSASSTRDFFLARLGETYLIAAEAYLKLGDPAKATDRINEVRRRAAKPGKSMQVSSTQVTLDFILDERARELAGEYHRWFDLKRTGKLIERTRLYNRDIKKWFDLGENPFQGPTGLKILRPIPAKALILNEEGVAQNPGY
ncbi:RagB/SusD family nutrient uptake outer membrane protein [Desertivirga brevis]|uniref:RagB/SusD family nutrient uptake outer membrane protein n=1 Tax=Desertivirga brevis TaxID=2810310 RepID=UPI001A95E18A|nr:RagB/SusD family nutrient uptake outer membrane protein [Pedobacter sp. SYSU D00873]